MRRTTPAVRDSNVRYSNPSNFKSIKRYIFYLLCDPDPAPPISPLYTVAMESFEPAANSSEFGWNASDRTAPMR